MSWLGTSDEQDPCGLVPPSASCLRCLEGLLGGRWGQGYLWAGAPRLRGGQEEGGPGKPSFPGQGRRACRTSTQKCGRTGWHETHWAEASVPETELGDIRTQMPGTDATRWVRGTCVGGEWGRQSGQGQVGRGSGPGGRVGDSSLSRQQGQTDPSSRNGEWT